MLGKHFFDARLLLSVPNLGVVDTQRVSKSEGQLSGRFLEAIRPQDRSDASQQVTEVTGLP